MRRTARGLGAVVIVALTVGRAAVSRAEPYEDRSPREAVGELMSRELKAETS